MTRIIGKFFLLLVSVTLIVYLGLLGASHVYISGGLATSVGSDMLPIWDVYNNVQIRKLPGLNDFGPIFVNKVTASHAIRNALFIFCFSAIAALAPLFLAILALFGIFSGVFMAKWDSFIVGILAAIMTPLSVFLIVLVILGTYFALLFQPSTPAYTAIWIIPGLLGAMGGTATSYNIIIIRAQP